MGNSVYKIIEIVGTSHQIMGGCGKDRLGDCREITGGYQSG